MSASARDHLKGKERKLSELVQFVKTRIDEVPNYTLLLGAGASASSGVRTASELVRAWLKDLFERECPGASFAVDEARSFFQKAHSAWYSTQREYASLFEKKFDLAKQRQMFVEQEVARAQPSIGYAYLIRLIEQDFFNTVFTTNFDDLLNEAFHQFSDTRPIVCAHDSAISSVTVTAKRPKVIKLHGDYLFDDIKSTVRETESLEENTKKKFVEFARDHGLIVVGYSGCDRSVMDVLQHLLKQEDYYRTGIYWCLRDDQDLSEDLVKLLWRERAYWVRVEGFDEFAAQLYAGCIGPELPISTALVSEKPREVISRFCDDPQLRTSRSNVIQGHLEQLRQELNEEALVESLRTVAHVDPEDDPFASEPTDQEFVKLLAIRKFIQDGNLAQAHEKLQHELSQTPREEFRDQLLLTRLRLERSQGKFPDALATCDQLSHSDPKNAFYFLKRAQIERSQEKRLESIAEALQRDPYYPYAYRVRAEMREEQLDVDPHCDVQKLILAIATDYDRSLQLNPSIQNSAWRGYISFLLENPESKERSRKLESLLSRLEALDAYSPLYLQLKANCVAKEPGDSSAQDAVLKQIRTAIDIQPRGPKVALQLVHLEALKQFKRRDELLEQQLVYRSDEKWQSERDCILFSARVLAEVEGKLPDAIRELKAYRAYRKDRQFLAKLIAYLQCMKNFEEAQALLNSSQGVLSSDLCQQLQLDIYEASDQYDRALALIHARRDAGVFQQAFSVFETHTLLKLRRYAEAERVARAVLEPASYDRRFDALIVNLEIACARQGRKEHRDRLEQVVQRSSSDDVRACACLMMDDKVKAAEYLTKAVVEDRTRAYSIAYWAIFDTPANRAWFNSTLASKAIGTQIASIPPVMAAS